MKRRIVISALGAAFLVGALQTEAAAITPPVVAADAVAGPALTSEVRYRGNAHARASYHRVAHHRVSHRHVVYRGHHHGNAVAAGAVLGLFGTLAAAATAPSYSYGYPYAEDYGYPYGGSAYYGYPAYSYPAYGYYSGAYPYAYGYGHRYHRAYYPRGYYHRNAGFYAGRAAYPGRGIYGAPGYGYRGGVARGGFVQGGFGRGGLAASLDRSGPIRPCAVVGSSGRAFASHAFQANRIRVA